MKIYLMRHGEAVDDIEDCYGGIADFPLTDLGREQAEGVASRLNGKFLALIYSSPLQRASETAKIISKILQLPDPIIIEDIQERNSYGVLSGINKDKAKVVFGRILSQLKEKPGYSKEHIPGCEPWDDFVLRVRRGFESIVRDAALRELSTIGIVTHGKFTQALFEEVLGLSEKVDLKLSAVNVIEYQPASALLQN